MFMELNVHGNILALVNEFSLLEDESVFSPDGLWEPSEDFAKCSVWQYNRPDHIESQTSSFSANLEETAFRFNTEICSVTKSSY